jgi:hypothetical protein
MEEVKDQQPSGEVFDQENPLDNKELSQKVTDVFDDVQQKGISFLEDALREMRITSTAVAQDPHVDDETRTVAIRNLRNLDRIENPDYLKQLHAQGGSKLDFGANDISNFRRKARRLKIVRLSVEETVKAVRAMPPSDRKKKFIAALGCLMTWAASASDDIVRDHDVFLHFLFLCIRSGTKTGITIDHINRLS